MLSAPEQGQFMTLLVQLPGTRRCLEIGVYTGGGALALPLAGGAAVLKERVCG